MGVGVRKGTKAVVVFLASRIPESQLDVLAIDLDIGDVVLKDGGNIDLEVVASASLLYSTCLLCIGQWPSIDPNRRIRESVCIGGMQIRDGRWQDDADGRG